MKYITVKREPICFFVDDFLKLYFMLNYSWSKMSVSGGCTGKGFSYTHIHVSIFFFRFFSHLDYYWVELFVLYSRSLLVIYFKYSSVCAFGRDSAVQLSDLRMIQLVNFDFLKLWLWNCVANKCWIFLSPWICQRSLFLGSIPH